MSMGAWNKGPNDEGQTMHTWHFGLLETRSNMRNEVKDGTDQRQDWSLTKSSWSAKGLGGFATPRTWSTLVVTVEVA